MESKNQSIVKIDYNPLKGLILKWNFNGHLNSQTYFRHIIVVDVDQAQQQSWKNFMHFYYEKIKLGDLITLSYETSDSKFNVLKWKQKTNGSKLNIANLKINQCQINTLLSMIDNIVKSTKQYSEPVVINFFTNRTNKELEKIQLYVNSKRTKKAFPFLFTFFCNEETDINVAKGFIKFDIKKQKIQKALTFYKSYLAQVAFLKVKISVQSSNGLLSTQDCEYWRNQEFNKISHQLYGPSVKYDQDVVQLLNEDPSDLVTYNLHVKLQFTQLNGRSYQADKKIVITAENQRIYLRTVGNRCFQNGLDLGKGFYCQRNPFRSLSYIWFKSPKFQLEKDSIY